MNRNSHSALLEQSKPGAVVQPELTKGLQQLERIKKQVQAITEQLHVVVTFRICKRAVCDPAELAGC